MPELTWILFLRILDERETYEAEAVDATHGFTLSQFRAIFAAGSP